MGGVLSRETGASILFGAGFERLTFWWKLRGHGFLSVDDTVKTERHNNGMCGSPPHANPVCPGAASAQAGIFPAKSPHSGLPLKDRLMVALGPSGKEEYPCQANCTAR